VPALDEAKETTLSASSSEVPPLPLALARATAGWILLLLGMAAWWCSGDAAEAEEAGGDDAPALLLFLLAPPEPKAGAWSGEGEK
jgi:hypothetical protein